MVNTARKGKRYEHYVRHEYLKQGYYCMRSAASKGVFDLIAINPDLKLIHVVQCKAGKVSKPEAERIKAEMAKFEGTYDVLGCLWEKEGNKRVLSK